MRENQAKNPDGHQQQLERIQHIRADKQIQQNQRHADERGRLPRARRDRCGPKRNETAFLAIPSPLIFLIFYLNSRISAASRGRARNESPAQSVAAPCGQSARRSGGARRSAFHTHFYNIVACFRLRFHCAAKNNSLKITRHTSGAHCLYAQNTPTKFVQDSQFCFDVGKRSRNFLTDGRQCAIMSKSNANPNDKGESA